MLLSLSLDSNDLQKHVSETLIPAYAKRWKLLVDAIDKHLGPLGVTIPWREPLVRDINSGNISTKAIQDSGSGTGSTLPDHVAGGYFIWIKLPKGIDATVIAGHAKEEENMILQTEAQCRAPTQTLRESKSPEELEAGDSENAVSHNNASIRLCLAWEDEDVLVEGVERLARVLTKFINNGPWERRYSSLADAR